MFRKISNRSNLYRPLNGIIHQRPFFYQVDRKEMEERTLQQRLRDESFRKRVISEFRQNQLRNVFFPEIVKFFKIAEIDEEIECAMEIVYASLRENSYSTTYFTSEIVNRFFVLCLLTKRVDLASRLWNDTTIPITKGTNLVLRYRQLLFQSESFKELVETFDHDELFESLKAEKWRDYVFYCAALYKLGNQDAFLKASEWFWKWDEYYFANNLPSKASFQIQSWLYSLLAMKNLEYSSAYNAIYSKKGAISGQITLQILSETGRIEEVIEKLREESDTITVLSIDLVRDMTSSVKNRTDGVENDDELAKEFFRVCEKLDQTVQLENKTIDEQVFDVLHGFSKRT